MSIYGVCQQTLKNVFVVDLDYFADFLMWMFRVQYKDTGNNSIVEKFLYYTSSKEIKFLTIVGYIVNSLCYAFSFMC